MSRPYRQPLLVAMLFCGMVAVSTSFAQNKDTDKDQPAKVAALWDKVTAVSKTSATLQVVVNPPLRRGTPIHDNVFKTLHDVQAPTPGSALRNSNRRRTARHRGTFL